MVIRARATLVEMRTMLVNSARGLAKSYGERLLSCGTGQVGEELAGPLSEPLQKIIRSRQDSLMLRTNLSACAFRFGDRGGNLTDSASKSATMFRNSVVNRGSRSWIK